MKHGYYRLAALSGPLASLVIRVMGGKLSRGLESFWRERPPDAVVCFVPFCGSVLRSSLLRVCPEAPLVTVVTDMAHSRAHSWFDRYDAVESVNHVICAGSAVLQAQATALGYPPAHVLATSGMVVHPVYYASNHFDVESGSAAATAASPSRRSRGAAGTAFEGGHLGADGEMAVGVIFFGGYAPAHVQRIVQSALASHAALRMVVICGGNSELLRRLKELNDPRCDAEGYLSPQQIRDFFRAADFVVGKPGPGVVAEALVCGLPYVTECRAPMAQEACVIDYLRSSGAGGEECKPNQS